MGKTYPEELRVHFVGGRRKPKGVEGRNIRARLTEAEFRLYERAADSECLDLWIWINSRLRKWLKHSGKIKPRMIAGKARGFRNFKDLNVRVLPQDVFDRISDLAEKYGTTKSTMLNTILLTEARKDTGQRNPPGVCYREPNESEDRYSQVVKKRLQEAGLQNGGKISNGPRNVGAGSRPRG